MNSILSPLKKTKKFESASSSSIPSETSSSSVAEPNNLALPEVLIAVDFGTTFSGFAYVRTSDPKLEISDNCIWPGSRRAGAASYCKNQTSLYYVPKPSAEGRLHLELKEWGWSAFLAFEKAVRGFISSHNPSSPATADPIHASETLAMNVGFFAHRFKLHFASQEYSRSLPVLPGDLTPKKLVVDYLRCLTKYTIEQLRIAIRDNFSMKNVQWCLSAPAVWDEEAKQLMRLFSEKAGMIKGNLCPSNDEASPYPLRIILEPEAASAYCQDEAGRNVQILQGDKILIADIGGGTIDIAVHEVLDITAASGITKVKEVVPSYGALGGGTFVDHLFFQLVNRKIECFSDFCQNSNQSLGLDILSWWQRVKADYDGADYSAEYCLMDSGLADSWRRHDRERGIQKADIEYNGLHLCSADFTQIFDPEVHKVIHLIEQQIRDVKILMIVGGFAASPYLKKRIRDAFKGRVKEIIIPLDPGRAIFTGAASLCMKRGYVQKFESASLSSIPSEPSSSSVAEPSNLALPEVVIAVDFGTTLSGFAYVRTSDPKLEIIENCIWPDSARAGAAGYSKNQTSLYYVPKPSADGRLHLELKEWGWSALLAYEKAVTCFNRSHNPSSPATADPIHASETLAMNVGFFAHRFKLYFASQEDSRSLPVLPGDLTPEKLVVDYLRCLTKYTIEQLRIAIRDDFSMKNVQWCVPVPAVWDEEAKQLMRLFSEKAGMIKGNLCPSNDEASPYPLRIISELEAASAYCQDEARRNVQILRGDKILIADIGGRTIDIAVHEVLDINTASFITKVKEAVPSYRARGGGTFVDHLFSQLVNRKIECFYDFCENSNPSLGLLILDWWQRVKADYDGDDQYSDKYYLIDSGLADAWRRHDRERGIQKADIEYTRLHLCSADLAQIFDPEVHKVIHLIEQQIRDVKILMIVGGFAASPYLQKRIRDAFKDRVKEIIIPLEPGRAICRGAASLCVKRDYARDLREEGLPGGDDDDGKRKWNRTFSVCLLRKGKR